MESRQRNSFKKKTSSPASSPRRMASGCSKLRSIVFEEISPLIPGTPK